MKLAMFFLIPGICVAAAPADSDANRTAAAGSDASAKSASDFSPSEEINSVLPRWLRFSGEYRSRFEAYAGGGFKPNSTDDYMLSRLRLDLTIRPAAWLKFFVEGQDARVFAKKPAGPPYQNTWDIRQGYVEVGDPEKKSFGLRAGRQELNFGEQRLIGSLNWTNTSRTFDAVRATVRHNGYRLDLFSASVVNPVEGTWDHHQQGNDIHGIYGGIEKFVPGATIEPYFFWRLQPRVKNESGKIANLDMRVPGVRWVGSLPLGFDYGLEMVKELGSLGSDSVHAWAGHWVIGRTAKTLRMTPRIFMEYNYASGDKNSNDGWRGTFDQLYPTGHDKYGLADQVGWRNIKDLRAGLAVKPRNNWTATLTYNDWYLASRFDALYSAASAVITRSPNGAAGTHVGQELDAQANWKIRKQLQAGVGFGHIFPGEFLKRTTPGRAYNFPYAMFTYTF